MLLILSHKNLEVNGMSICYKKAHKFSFLALNIEPGKSHYIRQHNALLFDVFL